MKHLFAALALILVTALSASASSEVPAISLEELKSDIAAKTVTTIDASGTYKDGHIPGAIDFFASQNDLASKLPADKGSLIVAYCYNPQCPAYRMATDAVTKLGYTNVKHFVGGIEGWKAAGEPTEK